MSAPASTRDLALIVADLMPAIDARLSALQRLDRWMRDHGMTERAEATEGIVTSIERMVLVPLVEDLLRHAEHAD